MPSVEQFATFLITFGVSAIAVILAVAWIYCHTPRRRRRL